MLLMCCLLTAGNLPPFQHVALNSSVTVPCPVLSAPEMVFRLYKGSDEIFYISVNNTIISKINNSPGMAFTVNVVDNSTSFILNGVTKNTTAMYTCEAERIFPPPFQKVEHKPQTIVFVEGMFTIFHFFFCSHNVDIVTVNSIMQRIKAIGNMISSLFVIQRLHYLCSG